MRHGALSVLALLLLTLAPRSARADEAVAAEWVAQCPVGSVPYESQGWWMPESGHIHLAFCAPLNAKLRGSTYALDIHAILHDDPGTIVRYFANINEVSVASIDVV